MTLYFENTGELYKIKYCDALKYSFRKLYETAKQNILSYPLLSGVHYIC